MFLKSLTISSLSKTIRKIKFRKGINLIVDEQMGITKLGEQIKLNPNQVEVTKPKKVGFFKRVFKKIFKVF